MLRSICRVFPAQSQTSPNISRWSFKNQVRVNGAERRLGFAAKYFTVALRMFSASTSESCFRVLTSFRFKPEMSSIGVSPGSVSHGSIIPPTAFSWIEAASRRPERPRIPTPFCPGLGLQGRNSPGRDGQAASPCSLLVFAAVPHFRPWELGLARCPKRQRWQQHGQR